MSTAPIHISKLMDPAANSFVGKVYHELGSLPAEFFDQVAEAAKGEPQQAGQGDQTTPAEKLGMRSVRRILERVLDKCKMQSANTDAVLSQAAKASRLYGKDNKFVTHIVPGSFIVEEERKEVDPSLRVPPTPVRHRDPAYVDVSVDKEARFVLIQNGEFSGPRGRAKVTKIVAREPELIERDGRLLVCERDGKGKMQVTTSIDPQAQTIVFENGQRKVTSSETPADKAQIAQALREQRTAELAAVMGTYQAPENWQNDIRWMPERGVRTALKEVNEADFRFGTELRVMSLDVEGREYSVTGDAQPINRIRTLFYNRGARNRSTGRYAPGPKRTNTAPRVTGHDERLDTSKMGIHQDRLYMTVKTAGSDLADQGLWLTDKVDVKVKYGAQEGLFHERSGFAMLDFLGNKRATDVPVEDLQGIGSSPVETSFEVTGKTVAQLMSSKLNMTWYTRDKAGKAKSSDTGKLAIDAKSVVFADAGKYEVAGAALNPLGTTTINPMAGLAAQGLKIYLTQVDGDPNAVVLHVETAAGFIKANEKGASVKGWKVAAGYYDAANVWQMVEGSAEMSKSVKASQKMSFEVPIDNYHAIPTSARFGHIRLYDAKSGLPAQELKFDLTKVPWAGDCDFCDDPVGQDPGQDPVQDPVQDPNKD